MVLETCLSVPVVKESESTGKFWGMMQMSRCLSDDSEGKAVQMILGCKLLLGGKCPVRTVCTLLRGVSYCLQLLVHLLFCDWCGLCRQ